ncbi:MAG TPA: hypothetical protein VGL23_20350 [Chloroflexota bacterium]
MAEPLAQQPLGVGAGLAALALAGAVAAPDLAAVCVAAVALPLAMIAYSVLAAARGTASSRRESDAIEATNAGLRRDILGSLQVLISGLRTDQAAEERRYVNLVGAFVRSADAIAVPIRQAETGAITAGGQLG